MPLSEVTTTTVATSETPVTMQRRIGSTTYQIAVYPSKTSKETMHDKITRMIKNETAGKAAGQ